MKHVLLSNSDQMGRFSTTMKRYPGSVSSAAPSKKSRCPVLSKKTDSVMGLLAFSPYLRTRHPRLPTFGPVAKHRESRGTTSCLQSSYCQRSTIMQTIVCTSRAIQRRLENLNGCFI